MKKKEKQALLILVIVAILIIAVIWFFTKSKDGKQTTTDGTQQQVLPSTEQTAQGEFTKVEADGTVVNTSETLKKDKEESGFAITNIEFKEKDGETIFTASVTNKTGSNQEGFFGNIVLLDKSGNEIGRIPVMLSDMENGERIDVEATITERYANAYDFKLER